MASCITAEISPVELLRDLRAILRLRLMHSRKIHGLSPPKRKLPELLGAVSSLPLQDMRTGHVTGLLSVCGRLRHVDPALWNLAPTLVTPSLEAASEKRLAFVARSFADAELHSIPMLNALTSRLEVLAEAGGCNGSAPSTPASTMCAPEEDARSLTELVESLGRLHMANAENDAWGRQRAVKVVEAQLAMRLTDLTLTEHARALLGFSRLQASCSEVLRGTRVRLSQLARNGSEELTPPDATRLVSAYVNMAVRDRVVLASVSDALRARCERHPVPAASLAILVRGLVTQLGPPPASFKRVLEASLPTAASRFELYELVLVVPALAFVPTLSGRNLAAVFFACLAKLSDLRPSALVGIMRTAGAVGHAEVNFWTPVLQEATSSIACRDWKIDDLANVSLIAARIATVPSEEVSLSSAAAAAKDLLSEASRAIAARIDVCGPRELGLLATALSKGREHGSVFGLISHRAMQLLHSSEPFGSRDVAQLLAALASFGFHEERLIAALAARAEACFEEYDKTARDIVLSSLSALGGIPGNPQNGLSEALLQFELRHRRESERVAQHMVSAEVHPDAGSETERPTSGPAVVRLRTDQRTGLGRRSRKQRDRKSVV